MTTRKERFLIVKPSSLGDIIHAFPAVTLLAQKHPDALIDWVAVPAFTEIIQYHPAVRKVIPFRRKELGKIFRFPGAFLELCKELRAEKYTAVLDLQGLLRSGILSRLARTDLAAGPALPREGSAALFYHRKLNAGDPSSHAVWKNLRMTADFLGTDIPEVPVFEMPVKPEPYAKIRTALQGIAEKKIIAIAPGARWKTKEWPVEFFAGTANALAAAEPDAAFVILGSPSEVPQAEKLKSLLHAPVVDLAGKTGTSELTEAIRCSRALLCNDSGPMHIAAALGVPAFAMFGPTDPGLTGPFSDKAKVFQPENLACLRCFQRECPDMKCQRAIRPETVCEAVLPILQ